METNSGQGSPHVEKLHSHVCSKSLWVLLVRCNQEGRVAGGLGAVTGFEWWPIKAYKPCGKAAKAGVLYTRYCLLCQCLELEDSRNALIIV